MPYNSKVKFLFKFSKRRKLSPKWMLPTSDRLSNRNIENSLAPVTQMITKWRYRKCSLNYSLIYPPILINFFSANQLFRAIISNLLIIPTVILADETEKQ